MTTAKAYQALGAVLTCRKRAEMRTHIAHRARLVQRRPFIEANPAARLDALKRGSDQETEAKLDPLTAAEVHALADAIDPTTARSS
jgi:hypothetical protein